MLGTGGLPSGEVVIEILLDPPGHVRLPIADDEIISRILASEPLAGRPIILVTYDTGAGYAGPGGRPAGPQARQARAQPDPQPAAAAGRNYDRKTAGSAGASA